jgi:hypothetical protein
VRERGENICVFLYIVYWPNIIKSANFDCDDGTYINILYMSHTIYEAAIAGTYRKI